MQVLRGDVLELVCLVDDGVLAGGDDLAVRTLSDGGVGAQQVVVDDDEIGGGGALPHPCHETLLELRAVAAEAGVGGGGDVVPRR